VRFIILPLCNKQVLIEFCFGVGLSHANPGEEEDDEDVGISFV
jgi:hypothetical protein